MTVDDLADAWVETQRAEATAAQARRHAEEDLASALGGPGLYRLRSRTVRVTDDGRVTWL